MTEKLAGRTLLKRLLGGQCPFCATSTDSSFDGEFSIDFDDVWVDAACPECGAEWKEIYRLRLIQDKKTGTFYDIPDVRSI